MNFDHLIYWTLFGPKPPNDLVLSSLSEATGFAPIIDTDGEQQKKLHIQKEGAAAGGVADRVDGTPSKETPAASSQSQNVHIQKDNLREVAPRMWMGDQEKNDYIILQSVLARATEIVNANYADFPQLVKKGSGIVHEPDDFVDILDARCNLIERISDRLFEYVKKKVRDEIIIQDCRKPKQD